MTTEESTYYCYSHSVCGRIVYVGKGKGNRAWSKNRSALWKRVTSNGYQVYIIEDNLTEEQAFDLERRVINLLMEEYRGNCSANKAIRDTILRLRDERRQLRRLYIPRSDQDEEMSKMWYYEGTD